MKLTNYVIIFCMIAFCLVFVNDTKSRNLTELSQKKVEYNIALDSAVDDSILSLVEVDSKQHITLNKNAGVESFFNSLYANFGVMTDQKMQETLQAYVPIIAITFTDGYYVLYKDEYTNSQGELLLKQRWTEKQPYVYEDENMVYNFTVTDEIKIYDKKTNEVYEGNYKDLKPLFPDSILVDDVLFDTIRRSTIINLLTEDMNYYITNYNDIAKHFGISYNFALPQIEKEDWYRTIDDISMLVVFQGYPYGFATNDTYNRYAFAGSRIKKQKAFYIEANPSDGLKYYHRLDCNLLNDKEIPYYSKKDAALEGAYPCLECNP